MAIRSETIERIGHKTAEKCGCTVGEARKAILDYFKWCYDVFNAQSYPPGLTKEEFEDQRVVVVIPLIGSFLITYNHYAELRYGLLPIAKRKHIYDKSKKNKADVHGDCDNGE